MGGGTMKFETKFGIGDRVFLIRSKAARRIKSCITCHGTGSIAVGGESFICPKCCGSSAYPQLAGDLWFVDVESTIGQIEVRKTSAAHVYAGKPETEVKYMLVATGVGSGTIWPEEVLFPDRATAEAECNARNLVVPSDDPGAAQKRPAYRDSYTDSEFAEIIPQHT